MALVSIGCSSFFSTTMPIVQSTNFELCDKMKKNARMQNIFLRNKYQFKKDMTISHHVSIERF